MALHQLRLLGLAVGAGVVAVGARAPRAVVAPVPLVAEAAVHAVGVPGGRRVQRGPVHPLPLRYFARQLADRHALAVAVAVVGARQVLARGPVEVVGALALPGGPVAEPPRRALHHRRVRLLVRTRKVEPSLSFGARAFAAVAAHPPLFALTAVTVFVAGAAGVARDLPCALCYLPVIDRVHGATVAADACIAVPIAAAEPGQRVEVALAGALGRGAPPAVRAGAVLLLRRLRVVAQEGLPAPLHRDRPIQRAVLHPQGPVRRHPEVHLQVVAGAELLVELHHRDHVLVRAAHLLPRAQGHAHVSDGINLLQLVLQAGGGQARGVDVPGDCVSETELESTGGGKAVE
mmetsp:Transcript_9621/g.15635  ORF Transcript_9621/g.15635 Transcript_9621/m.15635 type:complete len:347 (-) Transcript_9621:751-1791(-)